MIRKVSSATLSNWSWPGLHENPPDFTDSHTNLDFWLVLENNHCLAWTWSRVTSRESFQSASKWHCSVGPKRGDYHVKLSCLSVLWFMVWAFPPLSSLPSLHSPYRLPSHALPMPAKYTLYTQALSTAVSHSGTCQGHLLHKSFSQSTFESERGNHRETWQPAQGSHSPLQSYVWVLQHILIVK